MKKDLIRQFIKFSAVGILNTIVSLAVYYVLIFLRVYYLIANTFAFIISVLNSYYFNRKYVFKNEGSVLKSLLKMYSVYIITYLLGMIILYILVEKMFISKLIAPIMVIMLQVPINFIFNKNWAMK